MFDPYLDGLQDLDGFQRIWVLFWCHRSNRPRMRVIPYRDSVGTVCSQPVLRHGPTQLACPLCGCTKLSATCCTLANLTSWTARPYWTSSPMYRSTTAIPLSNVAGSMRNEPRRASSLPTTDLKSSQGIVRSENGSKIDTPAPFTKRNGRRRGNRHSHPLLSRFGVHGDASFTLKQTIDRLVKHQELDFLDSVFQHFSRSLVPESDYPIK